MWRLVHPLTSVLFEPNEFSFRGVEDTVSNQGFTRGDIDNQSFNSSAELLCCVRAVYIWTVDFFFFFLVLLLFVCKRYCRGIRQEDRTQWGVKTGCFALLLRLTYCWSWQGGKRVEELIWRVCAPFCSLMLHRLGLTL